jgi:UDP-glucose 4-epimerase
MPRPEDFAHFALDPGAPGGTAAPAPRPDTRAATAEALGRGRAAQPAGDPHEIAAGAAPGEKVLITGVAGGQGRLIARRLADRFEVCGVDRLPWEGHPRSLRFHLLDLRKKKFQDIFRTERPAAVVHLAFVRHFGLDPRLRHEVNVLGTQQLLEYCAAYGVRRVVVLSTSYVYGALPENPYYMTEDAPLNVSRTYPEVRDLAEVDTLCSGFLWRHPEIATAILRPVNTLGYYVHSAIGRYLKLDYVPTIFGFNPMMQFIHEEDLAEAVALALQAGAHGVFNVAGPGAVPVEVAIRATGGTPLPIPEAAARAIFGALFRFGLYPFPPGAIDFVKYPCTVDASRFRRATGFTPLFTLEDIFASVRH